jgi:hypothetical protein
MIKIFTFTIGIIKLIDLKFNNVNNVLIFVSLIEKFASFCTTDLNDLSDRACDMQAKMMKNNIESLVTIEKVWSERSDRSVSNTKIFVVR